MSKGPPEIKVHEMLIPLADFLKSYNKNMPENYPRASAQLLKKFQETHVGLFKHGDLWSLGEHRKRFMDWLPRKDSVG